MAKEKVSTVLNYWDRTGTYCIAMKVKGDILDILHQLRSYIQYTNKYNCNRFEGNKCISENQSKDRDKQENADWLHILNFIQTRDLCSIEIGIIYSTCSDDATR